MSLTVDFSFQIPDEYLGDIVELNLVEPVVSVIDFELTPVSSTAVIEESATTIVVLEETVVTTVVLEDE